MLTKEKLDELKTKLEKTRQELEAEIKKLTEVVPDFGSDTDHLEEEADETEEFTNQLSGVLPLKERLADVMSALEKMSLGTYGKCEKCGKPIEPDLLEVDPESRMCRECKKGV